MRLKIVRCDMNSYEKQLLETARRVLANSPNLNNTQKLIIENLFEQIERCANNGGKYI